MVKVEKRIKVHKKGKILEALALFDTGSRSSYFSREFAEKIGYEPCERVRDISLAVRGKHAIVGDTTVLFGSRRIYTSGEGDNRGHRGFNN